MYTYTCCNENLRIAQRTRKSMDENKSKYHEKSIENPSKILQKSIKNPSKIDSKSMKIEAWRGSGRLMAPKPVLGGIWGGP